MTSLSGPVKGGSGRPFSHPRVDLAAAGYRETEFLLTGTATRYQPRPGSDIGRDGRWDVEPAGTAPYATRLVVYRPIDPDAFNGTVVVLWNNVSSGFDIYDVGNLQSGFAFVAVSAQRAGVHGVGDTPMGLVQTDPERYGSLSIPSDDYSYDVFTQAAQAVAPDRNRDPLDPLDGLDVNHLIAAGGSQSAARLVTYINAVQPLQGVFDGFVPFLYFGSGSPLEVGDFVLTPSLLHAGHPSLMPLLIRDELGVACRIRDDLDSFVLIVNSELEAIACYEVRQPDTDRLRIWEIAGTSHVSAPTMRKWPPADGSEASIPNITEVPIDPVLEAAYGHLQSWVVDGTTPPVQPRIEFAGDPPQVVRDDNGIALGGIRLPQVEVPLATNSAVPLPGSEGTFALGGSCIPFSAEKLRGLYGDVDMYLARFSDAARNAEKAGVLPSSHMESFVEEARARITDALA